jgi:hypothetical protein
MLERPSVVNSDDSFAYHAFGSEPADPMPPSSNATIVTTVLGTRQSVHLRIVCTGLHCCCGTGADRACSIVPVVASRGSATLKSGYTPISARFMTNLG